MIRQRFKIKKYFPAAVRAIALILCLAACQKEDVPEPQRARAILLYMAGDNNLGAQIDRNIAQIIEGAQGLDTRQYEFLIYADQRGHTPALFRLAERGGAVDTVRVRDYEEHNSAQARTLGQVLHDVRADFPAPSYGLILWSHGTAWFPDNGNGYLRSFGIEDDETTEIDELADVLQGQRLDFLLFDACYMGVAEVVYQLRDVADHIIASPTEVLSTGFPYADLMPLFLAPTVDAVALARTFFNYYDQMSGDWRTATVSVTDTDALPRLAEATRDALGGRTLADMTRLDASGLQALEHLSRATPCLYDLRDIVAAVATPEALARFDEALADAVPYAAATPTAYFDSPGYSLSIRSFCGLSAYLPREGLDRLSEWYRRLDWHEAVYDK